MRYPVTGEPLPLLGKLVLCLDLSMGGLSLTGFIVPGPVTSKACSACSVAVGRKGGILNSDLGDRILGGGRIESRMSSPKPLSKGSLFDTIVSDLLFGVGPAMIIYVGFSL